MRAVLLPLLAPAIVLAPSLIPAVLGSRWDGDGRPLPASPRGGHRPRGRQRVRGFALRHREHSSARRASGRHVRHAGTHDAAASFSSTGSGGGDRSSLRFRDHSRRLRWPRRPSTRDTAHWRRRRACALCRPVVAQAPATSEHFCRLLPQDVHGLAPATTATLVGLLAMVVAFRRGVYGDHGRRPSPSCGPRGTGELNFKSISRATAKDHHVRSEPPGSEPRLREWLSDSLGLNGVEVHSGIPETCRTEIFFLACSLM